MCVFVHIYTSLWTHARVHVGMYTCTQVGVEVSGEEESEGGEPGGLRDQ